MAEVELLRLQRQVRFHAVFSLNPTTALTLEFAIDFQKNMGRGQ